MKILKTLYILALAVLAVACGDDTEFRIAGEVQGLGTRAINMLYVADGSVRSVSTAAIDGKFDLRGNSRTEQHFIASSTLRTLRKTR